MDKFQRAYVPPNPVFDEQFISQMKARFPDYPEAKVRRLLKEEQNQEIWKNSLYQVSKRKVGYGFASMYWLSIKRIDKEPIRNWRATCRKSRTSWWVPSAKAWSFSQRSPGWWTVPTSTTCGWSPTRPSASPSASTPGAWSITNHRTHSGNRRPKVSDTAVREVRQLHFKVHAPGIVALVRQAYWMENRQKWAVDTLKCLNGITDAQVDAILNGKINELTAENAALQERVEKLEKDDYHQFIPNGEDCYGACEEPTCIFLFNGYWCQLKQGYTKNFKYGSQKRDDCPKPFQPQPKEGNKNYGKDKRQV